MFAIKQKWQGNLFYRFFMCLFWARAGGNKRKQKTAEAQPAHGTSIIRFIYFVFFPIHKNLPWEKSISGGKFNVEVELGKLPIISERSFEWNWWHFSALLVTQITFQIQKRKIRTSLTSQPSAELHHRLLPFKFSSVRPKTNSIFRSSSRCYKLFHPPQRTEIPSASFSHCFQIAKGSTYTQKWFCLLFFWLMEAVEGMIKQQTYILIIFKCRTRVKFNI